MIETEKKFTLTDREGNVHSYRVTPLPASQNIDLALEFAALIAEPGMRLISLGIQARGADVDLNEVVADLDLSELGSDLSSALRALAARPKILFRFFAGCVRDEKDLTVTSAFDGAYTANIGECIAALRKIIEINGFLDFLDSLRS